MSKLLTPIRIAIVLAAALTLVLVGFAVAGDIGEPSVPKDNVAVVNGKNISQATFDQALTQAAASQTPGAAAPKKGSPEYQAVHDQAMNNVLDIAWIEGEAEDQGITVSDREVEQKLEELKGQNFKTEAEFQKFLRQQHFTEEDVLDRARVQLLAEDLQKKIAGKAPEVTEDDVRDFYDQNESQFQQPETRDVRLILNADKAKAEKALELLEADDSDENWNTVAKKYSTDDVSNKKGGLRPEIASGVLPTPLDADVFKASEGELSALIKTDEGYYVYQVDKITPASTRPFDDVSEQIKTQLEGQAKQTAFTDFLADYRAKWTDLTTCADGYIIDRCDNFKPKGPTACSATNLETTGCAAPVTGRTVQEPGLFGGGGGPQRAHPAGEVAPAGNPATPAGAVPGSAPGATAAPPPGG